MFLRLQLSVVMVMGAPCWLELPWTLPSLDQPEVHLLSFLPYSWPDTPGPGSSS